MRRRNTQTSPRSKTAKTVNDANTKRIKRDIGKEAGKEVVKTLFSTRTAMLLRECVALWETLLLFYNNGGLLPSSSGETEFKHITTNLNIQSLVAGIARRKAYIPRILVMSLVVHRQMFVDINDIASQRVFTFISVVGHMLTHLLSKTFH